MTSEYWKNATPEQKLLWDYASALIAYTTITPLYFQGAIAGSEFLTYNAGKLYIAVDASFSGPSATSLNAAQVAFYDQANAVNGYIINSYPYWDVTGAAVRFLITTMFIKNFFFSRILNNAPVTYMLFKGYRLNV